MKDKFSATWVSHSSIGDFLQCPRLYYLKNVYKDPKTRHKVNIINPPLALGQVVHEIVEGLADVPSGKRFEKPLVPAFEEAWEKVSGKKGGFTSDEEEAEVKARGVAMIERVERVQDPLNNKVIRMNQELPHYYLSEEDDIILCGKIDWLEYIEGDDSVHVIDFKTGKNEEKEDSLQLPIYSLLLKNTQKRKVSRASYWYLDRDDDLIEKPLPDLEESYKRVIEVAREIKDVRTRKAYDCPRGSDGCFACRQFEKILNGEAEFVGVGGYNQDLYILPKN